MLRKLKNTLILLMLVPFSLIGQDYDTWFQGGLTAKVVSARMTITSDLVATSDMEAEIGYQFGGFFRISVDNIYVEPQLLFSTIKTQLVFKDFGQIPGFDPVASFEFNTLELPIDIGMRFGQLRINTGPSFSFLISGQRAFLNQVEKVTEEYNSLNMLWHFGLGGDFDPILLDLRYEFGLSKTGESLSNLIGTEFIPRQRQWVIAVGLNLIRE